MGNETSKGAPPPRPDSSQLPPIQQLPDGTDDPVAVEPASTGLQAGPLPAESVGTPPLDPPTPSHRPPLTPASKPSGTFAAMLSKTKNSIVNSFAGPLTDRRVTRGATDYSPAEYQREEARLIVLAPTQPPLACAEPPARSIMEGAGSSADPTPRLKRRSPSGLGCAEEAALLREASALLPQPIYPCLRSALDRIPMGRHARDVEYVAQVFGSELDGAMVPLVKVAGICQTTQFREGAYMMDAEVAVVKHMAHCAFEAQLVKSTLLTAGHSLHSATMALAEADLLHVAMTAASADLDAVCTLIDSIQSLVGSEEWDAVTQLLASAPTLSGA